MNLSPVSGSQGEDQCPAPAKYNWFVKADGQLLAPPAISGRHEQILQASTSNVHIYVICSYTGVMFSHRRALGAMRRQYLIVSAICGSGKSLSHILWGNGKQPSSQACVAVDVDDQMDDDLLFYIDLHFLDKKCQESRLLTRKCCEDV